MVLHLLLRAAVYAGRDAAAAEASTPNYGQIVSLSKRLGNGSLYEGQWKVGAGPHGVGRLTLKSGAVYEGQWVAGHINGRGTFTYKNGSRYTGDFLNAKRHGSGTLWYHNGGVYVGGWQADQKNGAGTHYRADGSILYNGFYRGNKRHGMGELTMPNGDKYTGNFVHNKKSGQGTYVFANGDVFKGRFRADKRVDGEYLFRVQQSGPAAPSAPEHHFASAPSVREEPEDDATAGTDAAAASPAVPPEEVWSGLNAVQRTSVRVLACFPWGFDAETAVAALVRVAASGVACLSTSEDARMGVDELVEAGALMKDSDSMINVPYSLQVFLSEAASADAVEDSAAEGAMDVESATSIIGGVFVDRYLKLVEVVSAEGNTQAQHVAWLTMRRDASFMEWALLRLLDNDPKAFLDVLCVATNCIVMFPASVLAMWMEKLLEAHGITDIRMASPSLDPSAVEGELPLNAKLSIALFIYGDRLRMLDQPRDAEAALEASEAFAATCTGASPAAAAVHCHSRGRRLALAGKAAQLAPIETEVMALAPLSDHPMVTKLVRRFPMMKVLAYMRCRDYRAAAETALVFLNRVRGRCLVDELTAEALAAFALALTKGSGAGDSHTAKTHADNAVALAQIVFLKQYHLLALMAQGTCNLKLKVGVVATPREQHVVSCGVVWCGGVGWCSGFVVARVVLMQCRSSLVSSCRARDDLPHSLRAHALWWLCGRIGGDTPPQDTASRYGILQFEQCMAIAKEEQLYNYQDTAATLVSSRCVCVASHSLVHASARNNTT